MRAGSIVVVLVLLSAPFFAGSLRHQVEQDHFYVRAPQTHPLLLKALSLDLSSAVASVKWLKMLEFYGERLLRKDAETADFRWIWKSLQSQLYLDPYSLDTYVFASGVFPWRARKPEYSIQLLIYGALKRTQDWRIYLSLGYHLFAFFDKPRLAAQVWEMASKIDGRPEWLPGLTTMLLYEKRDLNGALAFLGALSESGGTGIYNEELQNMRVTIKMVQKLQKMADDFRQKKGYNISSLKDLQRAGYYRSLPHDPFGGQYSWDSSAHRVNTSTRLIPHRTEGKMIYKWNDDWLNPEVAYNLLDKRWSLQ